MRIDSYRLSLESSHEHLQRSLTHVSEKGEMVHTLSHHTEMENLELLAQGSIKSAGDSIDFTLSAALHDEESYTLERLVNKNAIDPLVINLNGALASVNQKKTFAFDLNGDKTLEEMALLSEGNAFLALDKNGNGKIDDGTELFGTQNGDGFAHLSEYDEDSNGVIDENDAIFTQLHLWQKSALKEGLITLKQARVGALLLDNVASSFLFTQEGNQSATLQKSGVVLFEDGRAGWMSHVDFFVTPLQRENPLSTSQEENTLAQPLFSFVKPTSQSASNTHEALVEMLEKRLHMLESKLSKTDDKSQKQALNLQILTLSQQISLLEMG